MELELPCVVLGCIYKTPELVYANASNQLKNHITVIHPATPQPETQSSRGDVEGKPHTTAVVMPCVFDLLLVHLASTLITQSLKYTKVTGVPSPPCMVTYV